MSTPHFYKIPLEEKEDFKKHLFTYLSELGVQELEYKYLDSYWIDKNRIPLYFYLGKEKIGFALINDYCLFQTQTPTLSIAEFYIFEKNRRNHFGKEMAIQLFDSFKGNWEVRTMKENKRSELFWENVISNYDSNFIKNSNHPNWNGFIFCFKSK